MMASAPVDAVIPRYRDNQADLAAELVEMPGGFPGNQEYVRLARGIRMILGERSGSCCPGSLSWVAILARWSRFVLLFKHEANKKAVFVVGGACARRDFHLGRRRRSACPSHGRRARRPTPTSRGSRPGMLEQSQLAHHPFDGQLAGDGAGPLPGCPRRLTLSVSEVRRRRVRALSSDAGPGDARGGRHQRGAERSSRATSSG